MTVPVDLPSITTSNLNTTLILLGILAIVYKVLARVADIFLVNRTHDSLDKFKKEILEHPDLITWEKLKVFCENAQHHCPNAVDLGRLMDLVESQTGTMKEVVDQQRVLRQEKLPKEYVSRADFQSTINRIEGNIKEVKVEVAESRKDITERIDKVMDKLK